MCKILGPLSSVLIYSILIASTPGCVVQGGGGGGSGGGGGGATSSAGAGILGASAGTWEIYSGCKMTLSGSTGSATCAIEPEVLTTKSGATGTVAGNKVFAITISESKVGISVTSTGQAIFLDGNCKITEDIVVFWKGDANKLSGKQESGLFTAFAGKWNGTLVEDLSISYKDSCKGPLAPIKLTVDTPFSLDLGGTTGTLSWTQTSDGKMLDDANLWIIAGTGGKITMTNSSGSKIKSFTKL